LAGCTVQISRVLTLSLALQIAAAPLPPAVYHGRSGQTEVQPPRFADTVTIDGELTEPVWRRAALLTGFSVYQPVDNQPSPDSAEVLVWYSREAIHFGIRAFEPHAAVRSSLAERDRVSSDDYVELHLDTFDERNRAFVFIVNPLGVQADGTKSEGGGFIPGSNVMPGQNDLSADFAWQSRGHLTEFGYEVEVRVPFSSLRYPMTATQDWGFQVVRRAQHSGYDETWTPAVRANASFITQAGRLRGLTGMHHGQLIDLNPELTSTIAGQLNLAAPDEWKYADRQNLGGNLRWTLGSNFVVNGAIKPDFSQVEADATQIATDPRFSLLYPEKRPFFVEGSDQFNVPNTLVYTRRIVSPDGAAKLTGKLGQTDVAVLSARDIGAALTPDDKPLVTIARLRRTVGGQSSVGMLLSDRTADTRANHLGGVDARILFGRLYYLQAQAAVSKTGGSAYTGSADPAAMWEVVVDRTGRSFGFHYAIIGLDSAFKADNGFVSRTGIISPSIRNRYTWYGRRGALLERYNAFGGIVGYLEYARPGAGVFEQQASVQNSFTLRGGWQLSINPAWTRYTLDARGYARLYVLTPFDSATGTFAPLVIESHPKAFMSSFGVTTPQFQRVDASVTWSAGTDVDFTEARAADRMSLSGSVNVRPTDRLRLSGTYTSTSYRRKGSGQQTLVSRIPRLKAEYQIARPLLVRVVSQYQSSSRAVAYDLASGSPIYTKLASGTYQVMPAAGLDQWRSDFLISYRPNPGTVVFAGYGSTFMRSENAPVFDELRRSDDAFFVKLSYLFRTALP
jgi:hypothetical protein